MTRLQVAVGTVDAPMETCSGCGLTLARGAGPTHAYIGASPACWSLYERISTGPFARAVGSRSRRLAEDAYAVQHPGTRDRRSVQSVAVHLMGLCVLIEGDGASRRLMPVLGRMPARRTLDLHWLEPPTPNGRLTVRDALAVGSGDAHAIAVEAWARDVWTAWRPHHATVRAWLSGAS